MDQLADPNLNKRIVNVLVNQSAYYWGRSDGISFSRIRKRIEQGDEVIVDEQAISKVELQQLIANLQNDSYVFPEKWSSPLYNTKPYRSACIESVNRILEALIRNEEVPEILDPKTPSYLMRIFFDGYGLGGKALGFLWAANQNADVAAINQEIEERKQFLQMHPEKGSHTMFASGRTEALIESLDLINEVKSGQSLPELDIPQSVYREYFADW